MQEHARVHENTRKNTTITILKQIKTIKDNIKKRFYTIDYKRKSLFRIYKLNFVRKNSEFVVSINNSK